MTGKRIVILGGGTGGLVAANRLRRRLGDEHRVVLVDRSPLYSFAPSFAWVMIGQRDGRRQAGGPATDHDRVERHRSITHDQDN